MVKVKEEKEKANRALSLARESTRHDQREKEDKGSEKSDVAKAKLEAEGKNAKGTKKKKEFEQEEYYLKEKMEDVIESLNLFKNDPLFFKPGTLLITLTQATRCRCVRMPKGNLCNFLVSFNTLLLGKLFGNPCFLHLCNCCLK